jgi:hypothetical protein
MGVRHGVSEEVSMTDKRDLKKLVRERQARTGESYVTSLRQVRARRVDGKPIDVVEMVDVTEVGASLGFTCPIVCTPTLAARIDTVAMLTRYRDLLVATGRDRAFDLMRDVVLRGEQRSDAAQLQTLISELREFFARARAGLGGVTASGRIVAMHVEATTGAQIVMFTLRLGVVPCFGRLRDPALGIGEVPERNDSMLAWPVPPW